MKLTLILSIMALGTTLLTTACDSGDSGPQPLGADNPPTLGSQIDRAGRPAISTALIATFDGDTTRKDARKDAYNAAAPSDWAGFAADIAGSLAILDSLDTDCGNQLLADDTNADGRYAALAGVLVDDQLYVNTGSGSCGYLGLEAEVVGAIPAGAGGCGGRHPANDVIDATYSVVAVGSTSGVSDGVDADDATISATFPYLAGPTL